MIGIYLITNTYNGKQYVGQSKDIIRRWDEHKRAYKYNNTYLYKAMRKYGIDCFKFEVIEECDFHDLNDKEKYYIAIYNTMIPHGYNMEPGGNDTTYLVGEKNPNSKMTDELVYQIRERYANGERKSNVYNDYSDIISINTFADIWIGKTWTHVHMDVYTMENKEKHKHMSSSEFHTTILSRDDVLFIRNCKNMGMVKSDVISEFFPHINYNTFSDVWYGNTFVDIISSVPETKPNKEKLYKSRSGCSNVNASLKEDVIIEIRKRKSAGETIRAVHKDYPDINRHTFSNVWYERTYKNIKY